MAARVVLTDDKSCLNHCGGASGTKDSGMRSALLVLIALPLTTPLIAQEADSLVARPVAPVVRKNVCPFECCVYREWTAIGEISVYATEGDTTAVAFTMSDGQSFTAIEGNVHLERLGLVAVHRTVTDTVYDTYHFEPGDSILVLDYVGEGFFTAWLDGQLEVTEAFWWFLDPEEDGDPAWTVVAEPDPHWWVRVQTKDDRNGWIYMNEARVTNADACG
jgi:hypothetical protein